MDVCLYRLEYMYRCIRINPTESAKNVRTKCILRAKYVYRVWDLAELFRVSDCQFQSHNHRVHRVATAAFWRTFSDEGKICPGWWGWGVHAHPLSLHLPSPLKLECTLQLSGQIHWPCFISTNMCTLWSQQSRVRSQHPPTQWNLRGGR